MGHPSPAEQNERCIYVDPDGIVTEIELPIERRLLDPHEDDVTEIISAQSFYSTARNEVST